jgi:hypothetical protein
MPPRRPVVSSACALTALALVLGGAPVGAQGARNRQWNDSATLHLVDRAIARRTAQLADTGLADYRAVAHGFLTFLAQVGEGFPDPPQVVRADELAVEVYWRAPNQSKQRVVGRRDTLLLPTDIAYHRDHLGVVQNNFPAIIRLGEGDEVRDVPHPLSPEGRMAYDFAAGDSLTIRVASREWNVATVDVRPRDARLARVVGSLFVDRETASVVRVALAFTRAALIDPALEDVSVVLDNGLVDGRFWLPRRQEIEIRRTGSWLDFPARGIIRGEWDLCCVQANVGIPAELFPGPEVVLAPPSTLRAYRFPGSLADSLAARIENAGPGRPAELVQHRAGELVRAAALARARRASLAARSVSDFVRVNRVEGLAFGGGVRARLPAAFEIDARARYGLDDGLAKHRIEVSRALPRMMRVSFAAFDEYRDVGDVRETSTLGNSLAAQELGIDFTDEYRVTGLGAALSAGGRLRVALGAESGRERALDVHASPRRGTFRPALPATRVDITRMTLRIAAPRLALPGSVRGAAAAQVAWTSAREPGADGSASAISFARTAVDVGLERALGGGTLTLSIVAAGTDRRSVPLQAGVFFGGPVTGPGYDAHGLRSTRGVATRVEWARRVGSFVVPLGRFGTTRVPVVAVPWVSDSRLGGAVGAGIPVVARSAGVGVVSLHDLLRLDVARGLDAAGGWAVYLDFGRPFWRIL